MVPQRFQRLKQKCDESLSNFAFNVNLRPYTLALFAPVLDYVLLFNGRSVFRAVVKAGPPLLRTTLVILAVFTLVCVVNYSIGASSTLYESFTGHVVSGLEGDFKSFLNLPGPMTELDPYGPKFPMSTLGDDPLTQLKIVWSIAISLLWGVILQSLFLGHIIDAFNTLLVERRAKAWLHTSPLVT